jgi:uncharacterized membrane protein YheB (UPF0754 family)
MSVEQRQRLSEQLRGWVAKTIGELLARIPDEDFARWIAAGARSQRGRQLLREGVRSSFARAMDVRIGRPSRWLPADATERIAGAVAPALWTWIVEQLPELVLQLDVEAMVERKVQGFSVERLEEIVRGVTERELRTIIRLGYLLGAVIGLITFGVSRVW